MNRTLLLAKNENLYFFPKINEFDVYSVYKQTDDAYFESIDNMKEESLTVLEPHFGPWINQLQNYETIIFLDFGFQPWMAQAIRKKTDARIIFYIWNLIDEAKQEVINILRTNQWVDDIYTFTPEDAEPYGLKHNSTFYKRIVEEKFPETFSYDVFFGGKNGGREQKILSLMDHFEANGLKTLLHAIDFETVERAPYVLYPEYVDLFLQSRAILEVLKDTQKGITLRSMESIFFERKLITSNNSIKNYRFYHPDNIFILGYDDEAALIDFLNKPYHPLDTAVIDYFLPDQWLKRFSLSQQEIFASQFIMDYTF